MANRRRKKGSAAGKVGAVVLFLIVILVPIYLMQMLPAFVEQLNEARPAGAGTATPVPPSEQAQPSLAPTPEKSRMPAPAPTSLAGGADDAEGEAPSLGREARPPIVPGTRAVYITFDDGVSEYTARILDILAREKVPATFFVVGDSISAQPDLLRRMQKEGHAIGNNTDTLNEDAVYASQEAFMQSVEACQTHITEILGEELPYKLFRFPGGSDGKRAKGLKDPVGEAGYLIFDWNANGGDGSSKKVSAAQVLKKVKSDSKGKKEVILRLHDATGKESTVEALPKIIKYFQDGGYTFGSLDQRVEDNGGPRQYMRK